jgi:hypothetical protein
MKIAITDACIFIDLIEYRLIHPFFKLDIEIHTSYEVRMEIGEHHDVLEGYKTSGLLCVHTLNAEQMKDVFTLNVPKGLSFPDRTVVYLARMLDAFVLTSDSLLRGYCKTICEVHGLIWVLRQLLEQEKHPAAEVQIIAQQLLTGNIFFANNTKTKDALEELIEKCGKLLNKAI